MGSTNLCKWKAKHYGGDDCVQSTPVIAVGVFLNETSNLKDQFPVIWDKLFLHLQNDFETLSTPFCTSLSPDISNIAHNHNLIS